MIRLIRMNLYYTVKTKAVWVLLLIAALLTAALYGISGVQDGDFRLSAFTGMVRGADALILAAIYTVLLAGAKYKTGYIKNIGNRYKNHSFFAADLITVSIFLVFLFLTALLTNYICVLVRDGHPEAGDILSLTPFLAVEFVQHTAAMSILLFFTGLIKNTTVCMAGGIAYFCIISILFWNIIDGIVKKFLPGVSVLDYIITYNVSKVTEEFNADLYLRCLISAAAALILFYVLELCFVDKRNIC